MRQRILILIILVLGIYPKIVFCQSTKTCYQDTFNGKSKVFHHMDNPPEFKGGRDSLSSFIAANLSVEKLINCLVPNKKVYTDTARVKFIVGRNGVLSNLTIDLTANSIFHHELFGAIIKSSCFWKPGNFGRNVDGWLQFDIYYMLEKEEYQIVTKLGIGKM